VCKPNKFLRSISGIISHEDVAYQEFLSPKVLLLKALSSDSNEGQETSKFFYYKYTCGSAVSGNKANSYSIFSLSFNQWKSGTKFNVTLAKQTITKNNLNVYSIYLSYEKSLQGFR
jgi:hypothetical protein